MKRRVLIVGPTRYSLPLNESLRKKFDALERALRATACSRAAPEGEDELPLLQPSGTRFYAELPARLARELRELPAGRGARAGPAHRGRGVLAGRTLARAQDAARPRGARQLAHRGAHVRLARAQLLGPASDVVAARAVRRADGVRTISPYTTRLVRELGGRARRRRSRRSPISTRSSRPPVPLPEQPVALFVGVLEHYKGIDELAAAWRARRAARARSVAARDRQGLAPAGRSRALREQVDWTSRPTLAGVAEALDRAWALVLPSRSEGMGRVILEAFCRNRAGDRQRRRRDRRPRPRRRERAARPAAGSGRARRGDRARALRPRARRAARRRRARRASSRCWRRPRSTRAACARSSTRSLVAMRLVFVTQQVDPGTRRWRRRCR